MHSLNIYVYGLLRRCGGHAIYPPWTEAESRLNFPTEVKSHDLQGDDINVTANIGGEISTSVCLVWWYHMIWTSACSTLEKEPWQSIWEQGINTTIAFLMLLTLLVQWHQYPSKACILILIVLFSFVSLLAEYLLLSMTQYSQPCSHYNISSVILCCLWLCECVHVRISKC